MTRNEQITQELNVFSDKKNMKNEKTSMDEYMDITSVRSEITQCDGNDSGVEMNARCCHCRSNTIEADSETDSCLISSSNGHSPMYYSTDINELVSATRKLSTADVELNGENSLVSYDTASENGSESSSLDDSKKCKSNCANVSKITVYCAKNSRRQMAPSSRSKNPFPNDSLKFNTKQSGSRSTTVSINDYNAKLKFGPAENKNRNLRSCSVTRTKTPGSPDESKWAEDRVSRSRLLPSNNVMEKITTFETYATLPRRKQKDNYNCSENRNIPREPSLNRAASLRKKFLENSIMTTSLNGSISSTSPSATKTMPPYVKSKPSKTKIYHEVSTQTVLTNSDVDHVLADHPFKIYNDLEIQAEAEYKIKKQCEEQMIPINEELKKLKKENSKQRTVIEWLESELASTKNDKFVLQNNLNSIEQRIYSLIRHKGTSDDVFRQLEREVSYSTKVIAQQQEEIAELQQMCSILKKDLDKSYSTQKTLIEVQKVNEAESLELQEFLQAEKSMLTDSLKDTELELQVCKTRLIETEQELVEKKKECINLESTSEQLRLGNQSMKNRLTGLEHRCRELLVHQGAAISSASVALSGLGSRFEQLLDQLVTAYNITEADLEDKKIENEFLVDDVNGKEVTNSSYPSFERSWLKAICSIVLKTSAEKQEDCNLSYKNNVEDVTTDTCREQIADRNEQKSNLNLISNDSSLYLSSKMDSDNRRNSILSEVYTEVDNLTLDFGVNETINDVFDVKIEKISSSTPDVALAEQINEVDNLVTKVFKAILLAQMSY